MTEESSGISVELVVILIDGTPLSETAMDNLAYLEVESSLDMPDMCLLSLRDDDLDFLEGTTFSLGAAIEVKFGDSDTKTTVMKGEIVSIEPDFTDQYSALFNIRAYDKTHRLNRGKGSEAFANQVSSDLVQSVMSAASLSPTVTSTSITHENMFRDSQTGASFVQQLARANGMMVQTDETGAVKFAAAPATSSKTVDQSLIWGENLRSFRPRVSIAGQVDTVKVHGWNPDTQEAVIGNKTSSSVHPTPEIVTGSGGSMASSALSAATHIEVRRPVTTQAEADKIAQAILDEVNSGFIEAEGSCAGIPEILAGEVIEIQGVGKFAGKYAVTTARHVYGRERYYTDFTVTGLRPRTVSNMIAGARITASEVERWPGVVPALVTNITDPDNKGRVKVEYPWMGENMESGWARVISVGAGADRGFQFLPEVGDEVIVTFWHGDFNYPYVLGGVYSTNQTSPDAALGVANGKVEIRTIRTRTGHIIRFTDTEGSEAIEIIYFGENASIKIDGDQAEPTITVNTAGTVNVTTTIDTNITAEGNVKVEATGNADVVAQGNVKIEAGGTLDMESTGAMKIKSIGAMTIEATGALEIKGSATVKVSAGATGEFSASAPLTLKGALVNIN